MTAHLLTATIIRSAHTLLSQLNIVIHFYRNKQLTQGRLFSKHILVNLLT